jgi:hypothetical protein
MLEFFSLGIRNSIRRSSEIKPDLRIDRINIRNLAVSALFLQVRWKIPHEFEIRIGKQKHLNTKKIEAWFADEKFSILPYFVISVESANAPDLADELGQMLLIKKLAKEGFVVNSFESHAIIEFPNVAKDLPDLIDTELADWITHKHSTLKKRKLNGMRKKLSLNISDQTNDELVCIELRPALRK